MKPLMTPFLKRFITFFLGVFFTTSLAQGIDLSPEKVDQLYQTRCAECHHRLRLGWTGPALIPEDLTRRTHEEVVETIAQGLPATQMPAFADKLTQEEIKALAGLVLSPLPVTPDWGLEEMTASRIVHHDSATLPGKPAYDADPLNLFVVVEKGDHHVTILDGDRLEPLIRFPSRRALHGGPKFSSDGRFVYFASRDGWISKYDLYNLTMVAEIRAGINTRNLAVSGDGHVVMVANYLPHTLVALDAETLNPLKIIPVVDEKGKSSRVSAVFTAPPRNTFIAALKDLPQVWEIAYNDRARPVIRGMVHDYREDSGEELNIDHGPFPVRIIQLEDYLDDFFFDSSYRHLIGASRDGQSGQVVNLDVGKKIKTIDIPGMPHLSSGITWLWGDTLVMATPNIKEGVITVVDMKSWQVVKRIKTLGPGFFLRSHENTPYAWSDVFLGPDKDAIHIIDKQTLEIVKTLRPTPGKKTAHVEFTRDGRFALLSLWEKEGAIIVFDAQTLQEVKRIPMNEPVGKYNVFNKITFSSGTSH